MNDTRRQAAIAAIHRYDLSMNLCSVHAPNIHHQAEAIAALEAADSFDAQHGVHRVQEGDEGPPRAVKAVQAFFGRRKVFITDAEASVLVGYVVEAMYPKSSSGRLRP